MNNAEKWNKFREAAARLTWAYLATDDKQQPHVRVVHPAFEGEKVWIATGRKSPKARQIEANPRVELFYAVGDQFVHLTVTGSARFVDDLEERSASGTVRCSTTNSGSSGPPERSHRISDSSW